MLMNHHFSLPLVLVISNYFSYAQVEDKFICSASGKVRYVTRPDQYLPLPVPMEEAINKEEVAAYQARKAELQAAQKVVSVYNSPSIN